MIASPKQSPSMALPMSFMLGGVGALVIGAGWLLADPAMVVEFHYRIATVAFVHLLLLGFVLTIVSGALYQLAPVIFETRLHNERLAWWHLVLHSVGVAGMVFSFLRWSMVDVGHWGGFVVMGIILLIYNIRKTAKKSPKRDVASFAIGMSLLWLALTVLAGLVFSVNRHAIFIRLSPLSLMHAHAHLGILGIFVILIMGISYKLVPMFALTQLVNVRRAYWSLWLVNSSLPVIFAGIAFDLRWIKLGGGALASAGLLLYGTEIGAMLAARSRRSVDWGVIQFVTAIGFLLPVTLWGLYLAGCETSADTSRAESAYAILAILGVVSFAILGFLQKIVPFLVWLGVYGRLVGHQKVPAITEMISPRMQGCGYWTYLTGVLALCAAALTQNKEGAVIGAIMIALSISCLLGSLARVMKHWFPQFHGTQGPAPSTSNLNYEQSVRT